MHARQLGGERHLERDAGRFQLGRDEVEQLAHGVVEVGARHLRFGQAGEAQVLLGDGGEPVHLAHDGVAQLARGGRPLAQLLGVERDAGEGIADLVGDLRRDAADGRQPLRAHQRLALRAQLALAGRQPLRHGVELARQERQLVASLLGNGHRLGAAAAQPLGRLGQGADGTQRPLREPHHEQADEQRQGGKPQHRPARRALLPPGLLDALVHQLLERLAQVLQLLVDAPLRRLQARHRVRVGRTRLRQRDERGGRCVLHGDARLHLLQPQSDAVEHLALGRSLLRGGHQLPRRLEVVRHHLPGVGAILGNHARPCPLIASRGQAVERLALAQLVVRLRHGDRAFELDVRPRKQRKPAPDAMQPYDSVN